MKVVLGDEKCKWGISGFLLLGVFFVLGIEGNFYTKKF